MSNTDHGKKRSRKNDLSPYFQRPKSKDSHSLYASSYFEQPITERDINSYENASSIQIIDNEICSSGDQSEINAFSPEIGSTNVKNISLEKNTTNSQKIQKGQWDIGRGFQPDWVSKFPFIHLLPPKNEKEKPKVKCNICSWILV
jgi:hypothetical protein